MSYFTTDEIESISLNNIEHMLRRTGGRKLQPQFEKNDKGPSWDGFIIVYNQDNSNSKDNISSRIPVQIKGTEVKKLDKKSKSFPISLSDLNNYLNDGGVIYFVVEVKSDEKEECRIFYKVLLPIDIQCILDDANQKGNGKTISVKLDNILNTNSDFYYTCKCFEIERQHQGISHVKTSKKFEELTVKDVEFLTINNPLNPFNKTIYPYVRDEFNCLIPLRETINVDEVILTRNQDLILNNKKYFNYFDRHINSSNETYYSFGDKIIIRNNKVTVKESIGNIEERFKTLEFIFDILFPEPIPSETSTKLAILKSERKIIKKMIEVCDRFHIDIKTVRIKDLTNDCLYFLDILYNTKKVTKLEQTVTELQLNIIPFLSKQILLLKVISEEKEYYLDFYDNNLDLVLSHKDRKQTFFLSRFIMLNSELILCQNFNYDTIFNSIGMCKEHYVAEFANNYNLLVLELIKAWDISNNEEYIKLATYILDWIKDDLDREISEINLAQIEYRVTGSLNYKAIEKLVNIKSTTNNIASVAAIFILLNDYEEFKECYNSFNEDKKKEFENYPIYYLYSRTKLTHSSNKD